MSDKNLVEILVAGKKKANTERLAQALESGIGRDQILGFGVSWDENKMPNMIRVELSEGADKTSVEQIIEDHLRAELKTDFEEVRQPLTLEALDERLKLLEMRLA